jgi:SanA protein
MSLRMKRILVFSLAAGVSLGSLGLALGLLANWAVNSAADGAIYSSIDDTPARPVAIVFGARTWRSGPSHILRDRIDAGIALYRAGKVKTLLMSGDHGRTDYDEVNAMLDYAVERGVPREDIFLDHAGFRTYDTLYRARDVFGVKAAILVTNEFHLPRAVYTGRRFGLDVIGLTSDRRTYRSWLRNNVREFLARTLAWTQVNITKPRPKFLGPKIDISGDGRVTHDRPTD